MFYVIRKDKVRATYSSLPVARHFARGHAKEYIGDTVRVLEVVEEFTEERQGGKGLGN